MAIIKNPITVVSGGGPAPSTPSEWGRLWCYSWKKGWTPTYDTGNCEVEFNQATFEDFIAMYPLDTQGGTVDPEVTIEYDAVSSGMPMIIISGFEAGDPFGGNATVQDLEQMGVTVTNYDPDGYFWIGIQYSMTLQEGAESANPPEPAYCFELNEDQFYNSLGAEEMPDADSEIDLGGILIPRSAVAKFEFGTHIAYTASYFLANCTNLRTIDSTNWHITQITHYFCYGCSKMNFAGPVDLSYIANSSIGMYFCAGCSNFNQPINFSSSTPYISHHFLYGAMNMVSTINLNSLPASRFETGDTLTAFNNNCASYTTGIPIAGTYASDFLTRFPNSSTYPYRNLMLAS